jgi:hypothetical protein
MEQRRPRKRSSTDRPHNVQKGFAKIEVSDKLHSRSWAALEKVGVSDVADEMEKLV